ncbi:MAG TPA: hypothetical protein VGH28_10785 [Polyangiaceae bacterium]|jgi:hypothetical protein
MLPLTFPLVLLALAALPVPVSITPAAPAPTTAQVPLGDIARDAARIAIRTAGLDATDSAVDGLASRARWSALLPELHVAVKDSSGGMHDYVTTTGAVTSSYFGPSYEVDGTLVFHLERLAYSGQEARLERLRLERIQARERVTQRVIEEIARWSKATAEEHDSPDGTELHADATARRVSAQMALDVWTDGWFSARLAGHVR